MDDRKVPEGYGRGGRGAALQAALLSQARRPGQDLPTESVVAPASTEIPAEPRVLGRGAFLQSLLSQSRPSATPEEPEPLRLPGRGLPILGGRGAALPGRNLSTSTLEESEPQRVPGRGLPLLGGKTTVFPGRGQPCSPAQNPPSPPKSESIESSPPSAELENLNIGNYRGAMGNQIDLEVNYVRLSKLPGKGIYEYHVGFNPDVDSKSMRFKLISQPVTKEIIGYVKTFDGAKLYLPIKLDHSPLSLAVTLPTDESSVTVTFKYIKECRPVDCLHLYNVLFRKTMNILKMTQVGRNYFDPQGGIPVPQHKLDIWPGYVTAVQDFEGGVMLNCDASFRVLRTITAREIIAEGSHGGNWKEAAEKNLIGCVVLTRYNNKTYRVDDISWNMNPLSTFESHGGKVISFVDYYKNAYDITIKDLKQPLIINKVKKKEATELDKDKFICLIPELCFMTGLTDAMRDDFKVMKDVASHTRITPERRQLALKRFVEKINNTPDAKKAFENWNLKVDSNLVSLEGRIYDPEKIIVGGNRSQTAGEQADWGRMVTNSNVLVAVSLKNWVIIHTQRDNLKVNDFVSMMHKVCPAMGIEVCDPIRKALKSDRTEFYCDAIKESVNPSVQIFVIIFPTPRDDRYSAVKKLCCVEVPVASQVINVKTISDQRKLRSVVQKIGLQINCKVGGELWSVPIPLSNVMICGMDTYHDNSHGRKSVYAFVSSLNHAVSRWFSTTRLQKSGQELGDCLKMMFLSSLRKYYDVNHRLPDQIVFYRDGVGDGQLDTVVKYEVEQLTSAFTTFDHEYSPTLSFIVVQKRINTRMYKVTNQNGRKVFDNPLPGTILDHTVTRKKWYDFFLISQHVRQGTVSPTHYVVVHNSTELKPDHMQKLAYKMTHMYFNWPGTVRVPAPCQYAHKLAYLVGQHIHKETSISLSDRLFYL